MVIDEMNFLGSDWLIELHEKLRIAHAKGEVCVGFHQFRDQKNLLNILGDIDVYKPLFKNRREFIREYVLLSYIAYGDMALSGLVCIHGSYDGEDTYWNGRGYLVSESYIMYADVIIKLDKVSFFSEYLEGTREYSKHPPCPS